VPQALRRLPSACPTAAHGSIRCTLLGAAVLPCPESTSQATVGPTALQCGVVGTVRQRTLLRQEQQQQPQHGSCSSSSGIGRATHLGTDTGGLRWMVGRCQLRCGSSSLSHAPQPRCWLLQLALQGLRMRSAYCYAELWHMRWQAGLSIRQVACHVAVARSAKAAWWLHVAARD
jgi:hypothetical protein